MSNSTSVTAALTVFVPSSATPAPSISTTMPKVPEVPVGTVKKEEINVPIASDSGINESDDASAPKAKTTGYN